MPSRACDFGSPNSNHNAGNNALSPATDQRGVARPQGPSSDIGAFEAAAVATNPLPTITSLNPSSGTAGSGVGEGPMDGRTAEKYRYGASTNTNTKAGEVKAEAFVYVDKETGLPLRAELLAESSGDVKGVKAARVVAEMRDIKTDVAPALFEPPAGYEQVAPEKVRQQIDALTSAVAAILKAMMANAVSSSTPSPAASAKP